MLLCTGIHKNFHEANIFRDNGRYSVVFGRLYPHIAGEADCADCEAHSYATASIAEVEIHDHRLGQLKADRRCISACHQLRV